MCADGVKVAQNRRLEVRVGLAVVGDDLLEHVFGMAIRVCNTNTHAGGFR